MLYKPSSVLVEGGWGRLWPLCERTSTTVRTRGHTSYRGPPCSYWSVYFEYGQNEYP